MECVSQKNDCCHLEADFIQFILLFLDARFLSQPLPAVWPRYDEVFRIDLGTGPAQTDFVVVDRIAEGNSGRLVDTGSAAGNPGHGFRTVDLDILDAVDMAHSGIPGCFGIVEFDQCEVHLQVLTLIAPELGTLGMHITFTSQISSIVHYIK